LIKNYKYIIFIVIVVMLKMLYPICRILDLMSEVDQSASVVQIGYWATSSIKSKTSDYRLIVDLAIV